MANLTYRTSNPTAPEATTVKNSPLTYEEMDGNLKSLNDAIDGLADDLAARPTSVAIQKAAEAAASAAAAATSEDAAEAAAVTATQRATQASNSADASAASASTAAAQATTATTQAGIATAQAVISTTKASEAAADRIQTGLDAAQTAADRIQTGLDKTQTAADRVQTGLDKTQTAADRVQTGLDRAQTGADRTQTTADRVQTGLDRTQTGADRVQTTADRVQTGLDVIAADTSATNAAASAAAAAASYDSFDDRYLGVYAADPTTDNDGDPLVEGSLYFNNITNTMMVYSFNVTFGVLMWNNIRPTEGQQNNINTVSRAINNVNKVGNAIDNVDLVGNSITNVNTVATNVTNVNTVATNVTNVNTVATNVNSVNTTATNIAAIVDAPNQAAAANTSAGQAAGSAAQALAIYGDTTAVQAAVTNAQNAASVAAGHAASASSVVQQDLSGVNAAALHRSPNAVTAMFIYDTSKDSDGGAWTEKCQHTSWYNEDMNGKWLGAWDSETSARNSLSTVGIELAVNGEFNADSNWSKGTGWTISNSAATLNGAIGSNYPVISQSYSYTASKVYRVTVVVSQFVSGVPQFLAGAGRQRGPSFRSAGTHVFYFTALSGDNLIGIQEQNGGTVNYSIDSISVREVTATTTQTGDYFQLTTDGRFYRLWKNLLQYTDDFSNAYWSKSASVTVTSSGGVGTISVPNTVGSGTNIFFKQSVTTIPQTVSSVQVRGPVGVSITLADDYGSTTAAFTGDWQTITLSANSNSGFHQFYIRTATANTAYSFDIRYPQLEVGSSATAYELKSGAVGSTSEVFRGNKRDFPRLAGIVAESTNVNIYDLTEPGRPMAFRFVAATNNMLQGTVSSISALCGDLIVGSNSGAFRVSIPRDSSIRYSTGADQFYRGNIAQRGGANGYL